MASIIYMTDFAEAYARGLLLGIARYAESVGEAWNICRLPLSIRDRFGIKAVVEYAYTHHADAVIGQFNPQDDVSLFTKQGILVLAQDFKSPFTDIPNIRGEYRKSGEMAADYFINKGFRNFGFYGVKHVNWSEDRRKGFLDVISSKVPGYSFYDMEMLKSDMWELRRRRHREMARKPSETGRDPGLRRQPCLLSHGVLPNHGALRKPRETPYP